MNYQLRVITIEVRWRPNFMIPNPSPEEMYLLKQAIKNEMPNADEYRIVCQADRIFMYALKLFE